MKKLSRPLSNTDVHHSINTVEETCREYKLTQSFALWGKVGTVQQAREYQLHSTQVYRKVCKQNVNIDFSLLKDNNLRRRQVRVNRHTQMWWRLK